jgi:hypothetical protein
MEYKQKRFLHGLFGISGSIKPGTPFFIGKIRDPGVSCLFISPALGIEISLKKKFYN